MVPALLVLQLKLWVPDGVVMGLSLEQDRGASRRLIWSSGAPPVSRVWGGICGIRRSAQPVIDSDATRVLCTGVRRYKLVLKDKTRPSITQNGSHAPPEHPGTHTRTQNDLAGPGSGARYAVVGHPEVGFRPFRSKVPLNLN